MLAAGRRPAEGFLGWQGCAGGHLQQRTANPSMLLLYSGAWGAQRRHAGPDLMLAITPDTRGGIGSRDAAPNGHVSLTLLGQVQILAVSPLCPISLRSAHSKTSRVRAIAP